MKDDGGQERVEAYYLSCANGKSYQGKDTGTNCQEGVEAYHYINVNCKSQQGEDTVISCQGEIKLITSCVSMVKVSRNQLSGRR